MFTRYAQDKRKISDDMVQLVGMVNVIISSLVGEDDGDGGWNIVFIFCGHKTQVAEIWPLTRRCSSLTVNCHGRNG